MFGLSLSKNFMLLVIVKMENLSEIGPTFNSVMCMINDQLNDKENKKKLMETYVHPVINEITVPVQRYLTIFLVLLIIILILQAVNTYILLN